MGARGCRQASSEVSVENMMRPLRITHYVKEGRVVKKRKKKHRAPIITANVSGGHYQKGEIYFRRGDYAAAIKAWRAAMKVQVPETNLARKLAEAHFRYALTCGPRLTHGSTSKRLSSRRSGLPLDQPEPDRRRRPSTRHRSLPFDTSGRPLPPCVGAFPRFRAA